MITDKQWKKLDIFLLILFPLLAVFLSLNLNLNYFSSLLLFGLPTAIWLSYRTQHMIKRSLVFSLLFAIPFSIVLDYIAHADGSWQITKSAFPRIFELVPLEDVVFAVIIVFNFVMFFEHFMHHGKHKLMEPKMKYLNIILFFMLAVFLAVYSINPAFLVIPYAYFWTGIIALLTPLLIYLSNSPQNINKFLIVSAYFFFVILALEYVALSLDYWSFPGTNFIGWIDIFGLKMPIEELFFFLGIWSISCLAWYEYFDDRK